MLLLFACLLFSCGVFSRGVPVCGQHEIVDLRTGYQTITSGLQTHARDHILSMVHEALCTYLSPSSLHDRHHEDTMVNGPTTTGNKTTAEIPKEETERLDGFP
jgi:hypothetical protein